MKDFSMPDYKGGSIVNLMSSIAKSFGAKTQYAPLRILPPEQLKDATNVVLLVIDGLGFNYLKKTRYSFLNSHLVGPMTSVFLPTTACAITTFCTGVAPQQHAFTGWYMHLKELGAVSAILPFSARYGGRPFNFDGVDIKEILDQKSFFTKIKAKNYNIALNDIAYSAFSTKMSEKSKTIVYKSFSGFFTQLKKTIKTGKKKKYIYAYWPGYDALSHEFGVEHRKSDAHFKQLDLKIKNIAKSLKGTNTVLIVTADHGFQNTPAERVIKLEDHPKLKECLTLPLCGEGRVAYCYVHPDKAKQFEDYVNSKLSRYCHMFKSRELIDKHFFGLFEPNPKLFERVGDYTLIFKENYIMKDTVMHKSKKKHVGHHGGITDNEMIVPLVLINCK
jgi:hypothetical protein